MNKEIRYNGFTETPSDYECPDGDIAAIINLVPEEHALKPVRPPSQLFTIPDKYNVQFIHNNSTYKHYILQQDKKIYWFNNTLIDNDTQLPVEITDEKLTLLREFTNMPISFNAVGNTLIVITEEAMYYFLWKNENNGYINLGSHIPELPISFGLQGRLVESWQESIEFKEKQTYFENVGFEINDSNKSAVTETVLAWINKYIAEYYTNGNEFLYPFFVRYAYRLYDGTLTMHSAPILMVCSTRQAPYLLATTAVHTGDTLNRISGCRIRGVLHKLDMAVVKQSNIDSLQNWSDIITSVDVFVSAPLFSYDQSGEVTHIDILSYDNDKDYCICKAYSLDPFTGEPFIPARDPEFYQKYQVHKMQAIFNYNSINWPGYSVRLPMKNLQKESIISNSQFYFLKSYSLNSLTTERKIIDIPKGYFSSLYNRETMSDDYDSHTTLAAKYSFVYNSRLNLTGISQKLFHGYNAASQFCYTNGYVQATVTTDSDGRKILRPDTTYDSYEDNISVFIYLKKDGKTFIVCGDGFTFGLYNKLPYIFYPDINAYKAVVLRINPITKAEWGYNFEKYFEVELKQHSMLNGAVYFNDWDEPTKYVNANLLWDSSVNKGSINLPNKIYTSEINNPFVFPPLGINTVGTGTILAISSAAKALSEGQFGQFPLYAFTTEGIWALEVSSEGKYTARQPITRDVCINQDSITQIDTAVLYATDRGIMLLSGSESLCISDIINAQTTFSTDALPHIHSLIGLENVESINYIPFRHFIKDCGMLYDYTHQRIIVYNNNQLYAYTYSLKSKSWGMIQSNILQTLNSYPEALAMIKGEDERRIIANYSGENENMQTINAILITRPLKLDAPDILKTVNAVIQRGNFKTGHIKTILYGSRDLFNWHLISSSNTHRINNVSGTPYKYFRIALLCDFEKDESVSGCSLAYKQRFTNKLR